MSSESANEWSTGLCGCFQDCRSCCLTCFCPCVAFGRIAEILDNGETSCSMMGCLFYLLNLSIHHAGLAWLISMGYRTKMRRKYAIKGGQCRDCMVHFFCQPCALCQEYRELQFKGFDVSAGWEGNAGKRVDATYTVPPGELEMKR